MNSLWQRAAMLMAGLVLVACGKQEPPAPAPAPATEALRPGPGARARQGVHVVGTDAAYAPFESQNEKGEIVGFDIDVVSAIAKKAGLR